MNSEFTGKNLFDSFIKSSVSFKITMVLLVIGILFCGCRSSCTNNAPDQPAASWDRTEIYFGLTTEESVPIDPKLWESFVTNNISPAFPDGFTILCGTGHWVDNTHKSRMEPSRLVVVWYPADQAVTFDRKIKILAAKYIHDFHQESVLRGDTKGNAIFYTSAIIAK